MVRPDGESSAEPLLDVSGLAVEFLGADRPLRAVRGLTYEIGSGEAFGLVGESGSGKSVSALAVMGLLPPRTSRVPSGSVRFRGTELVGLHPVAMQRIRGSEIAYVPQDPHTSLNPVLTVGRQVAEVLEVHRSTGRRAARARTKDLLAMVGIPDPARRLDAYPHQLSGGMRQRAIIAMALACEPSLLIADEPTTALDVTIQAQILALLGQLRDELGMAVLLITHDLGVVAGSTDRIGVMYAGRIVESGPTDRLLRQPSHPYTVGLMRAVPRLDRGKDEALQPIAGLPPDLRADLPGCPFAARCAWRVEACWTEPPPVRPAQGRAAPVGGELHVVACHNPPTSAEAARGTPDRPGFAPAAPPA